MKGGQDCIETVAETETGTMTVTEFTWTRPSSRTPARGCRTLVTESETETETVTVTEFNWTRWSIRTPDVG